VAEPEIEKLISSTTEGRAVDKKAAPVEGLYILTGDNELRDEVKLILARLDSDRFWKQYFAPRITLPIPEKEIRENFSASGCWIEASDHRHMLMRFDFKIRLETGGEMVFDAVQAGLVAYSKQLGMDRAGVRQSGIDFLRQRLAYFEKQDPGPKVAEKIKNTVARLAELEATPVPTPHFMRILSVEKPDWKD
jgi:hypothetical protein